MAGSLDEDEVEKTKHFNYGRLVAIVLLLLALGAWYLDLL